MFIANDWISKLMVQVERIAMAWNVGVDAVIDDPPPNYLEKIEKKRA